MLDHIYKITSQNDQIVVKNGNHDPPVVNFDKVP